MSSCCTLLLPHPLSCMSGWIYGYYFSFGKVAHMIFFWVHLKELNWNHSKGTLLKFARSKNFISFNASSQTSSSSSFLWPSFKFAHWLVPLQMYMYSSWWFLARICNNSPRKVILYVNFFYEFDNKKAVCLDL